MTYAGYTNWRLPNINELKTLRNYKKSAVASDFPSLVLDTFWSSTSYIPDMGKAWKTSFEYGEVYLAGKATESSVLCVR